MKKRDRSRGKLRKFLKNAPLKLTLGMIVMLLITLFAVITPFFYPNDPTITYQVPAKLKPCAEYPLGTTSLGQNVFAMLAYAVRNSLCTGIIVACVGSLVGIIWGMISGFIGKAADSMMMLVSDTFLVIPSLPVMILLTSLLNGAANLWQLALFISIFAWANPSRSIRTMILSIRERDFIATAQFSSENIWQIIFTEMLPYISGWVLSNFMNTILFAISSESGLALLGLSSGNLVTLGNMIQWARNRSAIMMGYWHWILPPVIVTVILISSLFFVINGYNEYKAIKRGK